MLKLPHTERVWLVIAPGVSQGWAVKSVHINMALSRANRDVMMVRKAMYATTSDVLFSMFRPRSWMLPSKASLRGFEANCVSTARWQRVLPLCQVLYGVSRILTSTCCLKPASGL